MVEKWTADEVQRAHDLAEQGLKYSEIASKIGRSENSVRNKLYELRKGGRSAARPVHVNITMTAAEYNGLVSSADKVKRLEETVAYYDTEMEKYERLFDICAALVKAYNGHRNTKQLFEELEKEMSENPYAPPY